MNELTKSLNQNEDKASVISEELMKILSNPQLFISKIKSLSDQLEKDKSIAENLKNKSIIKRLFTSSVKTQADANLRQNAIMKDFYELLTAISYLGLGNSAHLVSLYDSLCKSEEANGNNYFFEAAKAKLQFAIKSAKDEELREKALKKALVKSNENESKIDENASKIESVKKEILNKINNYVGFFTKHLKNKEAETVEDINSKIAYTRSYINEQVNILNNHFDQVDNGQRASFEMIKAISKEVSLWKTISIVSIVLNIVNFILLFAM